MPVRFAQTVKRRSPWAYARLRRVAALRGRLPPRELDGIPGRVHRNDFMLYGRAHVRSYAETGNATAEVILDAAAGSATRSWLDFGCGYGRVLRWIAKEVGGSAVGCFDVNSEASAFCAREFGATQLRSAAPLSEVTLGRWDFVYAISVVTHLPGDDFFCMLKRLLNPGGTVLFSTHGKWSIDNIGSYGREYAEQEHQVRAELLEHGISYLPYSYGDGSLGMTWHTPRYVIDHVPGLEFVSHTEQGLPGWHDMFVFRSPFT